MDWSILNNFTIVLSDTEQLTTISRTWQFLNIIIKSFARSPLKEILEKPRNKLTERYNLKILFWSHFFWPGSTVVRHISLSRRLYNREDREKNLRDVFKAIFGVFY